jgi:hypothetical protein
MANVVITPDDFNIYHLVHDYIVGLTGLDNTLVRPMYQPNPPTIPPFGTDWIGFHIKVTDTNGSSYQGYKNDVLMLQRDLVFEVTLAIYGNNAIATSSQILAGMELTQNIEIFRPYNIAFGTKGKLMRVPELHNQRWLERYNLDFTLNYIAVNKTNIMSITSVQSIDFNSK